MKRKVKTVNKKAVAALTVSFERLLNKEYSKRPTVSSRYNMGG